MRKITKTEFLKILQEDLEREHGIKMTLAELKVILDSILKLIAAVTKTYGEVAFREFGTFRRIRRKYRIGENEGIATQILFRPGKKFRNDEPDF